MVPTNVNPESLDQLDLLRLAKARLGVGWDALALQLDVSARTLKACREAPGSTGYRRLPGPARRTILHLLGVGASHSEPELWREA